MFFLALILQATLVPYIQIFHWRPDLILVLLVMFAIQFGQAAGSTAGFLNGLFSDLLSAHLLGLGSLTKAIAGFLSGNLATHLQQRSQFVLTLFIVGFIHDLLYFAIDTLGKSFSWELILFVYIIPNLFYTMILGTFIYYLLNRWLTEDD